MKKKKLILTVGLPRSGKSTWAKRQGLPIVNRDSIRLALHGKPFLREAEDMVTVIETLMVKSLFLAGHDTIIIDATHLKWAHRNKWRELFPDLDIEYKAFDTPKTVCIKRAIKDDREDLIPIIEKMSEMEE